jgi:hypothetical protein
VAPASGWPKAVPIRAATPRRPCIDRQIRTIVEAIRDAMRTPAMKDELSPVF